MGISHSGRDECEKGGGKGEKSARGGGGEEVCGEAKEKWEGRRGNECEGGEKSVINV